MRYALVLGLLIGILVIAPTSNRAEGGPLLQVTFVQWTPGPPPLRTDRPDAFSLDHDIIEQYAVGGTASVGSTVIVPSPSGHDARIMVFLVRPITGGPAVVKLPLPTDGTVFLQQCSLPTHCWLLFPTCEPAWDTFLSLSMDNARVANGDERMDYTLTVANGATQTGVAATWAPAKTQSNE